MIDITNKANFTEQCKRIMKRKVKPAINQAVAKGYVVAQEKSPQIKPTVTKDHLSKRTKAPKEGALYIKGIRFDGLDAGRKDALAKMQTGYRGMEPTNTPEMQEWLAKIGKGHWESLGHIEVGRNSRSRFYGGDKNPMQFGKAKMKEMIEKNLKVSFKSK